jgi:DNA-binding transcriptional regulator GbsR (MarR family)
LRNVFHVEDNVYKKQVLAYNKELDVLVSANFITISDLEEENPPPYSKDVVTNSKEEMTNLENTTPTATP